MKNELIYFYNKYVDSTYLSKIKQIRKKIKKPIV